MSADIGSVGSVQQGVSLPPVAAAPVMSSVSASGFAAYVSSSSNATPTENPRTVFDPTAGFITQYLSANGSQVVSQTPSAITVAYLRLGLTADGAAKPATQAFVATSA